MADEEWQRDALDACHRGLKQNEQVYRGFPGRLAANLLQRAGVLTGTDVTQIISVNITEQTATLFEILKGKAAIPNLISILRQELGSRGSLKVALPYLPQLEAPVIILQPAPPHIYCPLGQKVKLSCQAVGKPLPELQWFVDGQPIADKTGSTIEVETSGDYMCRATNRVSSVDSTSVAVAIVKNEAPLDVRRAGQVAIDQYYLDNIVRAPPEIVAQGLSARKAFYDAIRSSGSMVFHQTCLMVVGQDRVGKTTWVRAIVENKQHSDEETSSTNGIEFTLVKCNLDDPELLFEIPNPENEMEIVERAQARFIAEKIYGTELNLEKKQTLSTPQQVVQERETVDVDIQQPQPEFHNPIVMNQQADNSESFLAPATTQESTEIHENYPELSPRLSKLVGEELRKLRSNTLESHVQTSDRFLMLRICDFAGQPIYFNSHVFFLSDAGLYAILYDLTKDLKDVAKVLVGARGIETIVDSPGFDTNLDYFKTWMASIANTKQRPQQERLVGSEYTLLSPSALFIGTKLDELHLKHLTTGELATAIVEKKNTILEELTGSSSGKWKGGDANKEYAVLSSKDEEFKKNSAHMREPMFFVDNFKELPGSEREFNATRKRLVQLAMEQQTTTHLRPFSWILYELELYKKKKTCKYLMKDKYTELAMKHNIRVEDLDEVLRYFDKQKVVVYRPDSRLLSDVLIIDVDWLMRTFRSIIRIRQPAWKDNDDSWSKIKTTGIISYSMLDKALREEHLVTSKTELSFVTGLFQKFNLLVAFVQAHGQVKKYESSDLPVSQFVAPSLVMNNPDWELFVPLEELDPCKATVKPIYIRSTTGTIPDAVYNQLVARCISEYPLCPEVYRYFARIHIDHRYDLLLFNCKPHRKEARLPHEQEEAKGTIMITVIDVDPVTQHGVTISSICNQVLEYVLWAINDIKSTGLNGLQFALETPVYDALTSTWRFQRMSSFCASHFPCACPQGTCSPLLCQRHNVEACTSPWCFEQLFQTGYVGKIAAHQGWYGGSTLANALIVWISEHSVSVGLRHTPICQGCCTDAEMQDGYLVPPVVEPSTARRGDRVQIACKVQDINSIAEWRHRGQVMRQTRGTTVEIQNFTNEHDGIYTCRVATYDGDYAFSRPDLLSLPPKKELKVIRRMECKKCHSDHWISADSGHVLLGDVIRLQCITDEGKEVKYKWYFQGHPIPKESTHSCYEILSIRDYHDGEYVCRVWMDKEHEEEKSQAIVLQLQGGRHRYAVHAGELDRRRHRQFDQSLDEKVPDKVALLIGNSIYEDPLLHKPLKLPGNDVRVMTHVLQTCGFQTISFVDLNFFDMVAALDRFYSLVKQGVYAIVYYAGHGFEAEGEQYLLPVDADNENDIRRSIRAEGICCQLEQCGARLSLLILDCCRTMIVIPSRKRKVPLQEIGTAIIASSCCRGHQAYEATTGDNSVFTTALLEQLHQANSREPPISVTDILQRAQEGAVKQCEKLNIKNMYPIIRQTNPSTIFLTDECNVNGKIHVENSKIINTKCHGLPPPFKSETGSRRVLVTLEYRRTFSNVLVILCKMTLQSTDVSEVTAVFKFGNRFVDCAKQAVHGVVIQSQAQWVEAELEDQGRHDHSGICGPCLKIYGIQRARPGALSELALGLEVGYVHVQNVQSVGGVTVGDPKKEEINFKISRKKLPLVAADCWYE